MCYVLFQTEASTGNIPPVSEYDEAIITEIHLVLCSFVTGNAEAWAPIISTWSLELLGEISTKFAGRAHISNGKIDMTMFFFYINILFK